MKFAGMAVLGMARAMSNRSSININRPKSKQKPVEVKKQVPKPVRKVIINKNLQENSQERMLNRPFYRNYTPKKS